MFRNFIIAVTIFFAAAFSQVLAAAVPQAISYQGRLTTSAGDAVPDNVYSLNFSIYSWAVGGSPLWTSGFMPTQTEDGLFSVILGQNNPIPESVVTSDSLWLGITVNLDPEITPRTKLSSVLFAYKSLHSETSRSADSAVYSVQSIYADTSDFAVISQFAEHSIHADTAEVASTSFHSIFSDTTHYADTAFYASNSSPMRLIALNNSVFHSQSGDWTPLATIVIPGDSVSSFVWVNSLLRTTAANNGSQSWYAVFRITIDDVQQSQITPLTAQSGSGANIEFFLPLIYSPTALQQANGFTVKIEGMSVPGDNWAQASHLRTEIWGQ